MNSLVRTLLCQYFGTSHGELCIGETPVSAIAARYETPLFVYDQSILARKLTRLRSTLPAEFSVYYSVKANPNHTILHYFLAQGCGLEIASGGEFHRALKAGATAQRIVFAGPGKTEAELALVLERGIGEIHIESLSEVERIAAISRRLGTRAKVAIRINPTANAQGGAMRMGGKPAPFGIDEEKIDEVLERVLADESIELHGIHMFAGTQILDHRVLMSQYREGIEVARRVATNLQRPLQTLDFGGGLGIPYFSHEREIDMQSWQDELAVLMAEVRDDPLFVGTRFMVEPGRYLVGEAGIYVARVNDIKVSRGKKFLILDGGMNHHLAASGNLGQVIKRNFPLALVNRLDETAGETVDIVGPLCTPLDTLARDVEVPVAHIGDLVGIFQSGAYARTASPLGFLSHLTPPEIWVDGPNCRLIHPRGSYADL